MARKSSALSHFPAKTIGQTGLATLAFAGALAVIPAAAGDDVALVESVTSNYQHVELMSYAHVGQVIRLSPDQTMVLSYRDSCVRETITGGTITVGTEQSEVRSGQVKRTQENCATGNVELSGLEKTSAAGGRAFRGMAH
jgi:hypothetical protein